MKCAYHDLRQCLDVQHVTPSKSVLREGHPRAQAERAADGKAWEPMLPSDPRF